MIVDDTPSYCKYLQTLLERQNYQVVTAFSGEKALEIINSQKNISMVLLDYLLPNMTGYDVIRHIRKQFTSSELPIIGISGQVDQKIPALILKSGANDFIYKGFTVEEFYSRVSNVMDLLMRIQDLTNAAHKDFLTGLYNRKYFYTQANTLVSYSDDNKQKIALAMIDIDFFKKVNDLFGHQIGDDILQKVADCLQEHIRSDDILARLGGEEFCVIFSDMADDLIIERLENLRRSVEMISMESADSIVKVTISIGLKIRKSESLHDLMAAADIALYQAKESGRNRLVLAAS